MSNESIKRIPYGISDYRYLLEDNGYYVDKTHFIPLLEEAPPYLFCIRPRRFGKSLFLSILQHYYDINLKDEFEQLFGHTYIGQHPTTKQNSFLVMFLNFSGVNPNIRYVHESFEDNMMAEVEGFLRRYKRFFDEDSYQNILSHKSTEARLRRIFYYANENRLKIYLFIDEYDNFANTILATEGQQAYEELTHGAGFFRYFFNFLKSATGGQLSGLERLFISGVSPITMDDVTSGFNIGSNICLEARFNEMIGFTEAEVRQLLTYYVEAGALKLSVDYCLSIMKVWYNNYRFSEDAETYLFNSNLVLYFVEKTRGRTRLPRNLIDQNMTSDYNKLRHLVVVDQQLNGNFSQLQSIIETGEVMSEIAQSFPLELLLHRENFVSLLYYLGLLTFVDEREGLPVLRIPNRTVKDLLYGYIRNGFRDVEVFRIDPWELAKLIQGMAYRGEWEAVFDFLTDEIKKQTAIRDYLSGEKVIQGFLLAYLNITHFFLIWSEQDLGKGFVDLYLEPFLARYPDMKYGYLIEIEYIQRSQFTKERLQKEIKEAEAQLKQYANDPRIQEVAAQLPIKKLILVYNGWELVYKKEWLDHNKQPAQSTQSA